MTSPGVRVPLPDEEMLPMQVPDPLRKIVGQWVKTVDAYQYCTQSNSKGTLNRRVLTVTTESNPPTLFLSKEDTNLTRVVPVVNIASAWFRKGKRGENITMLNMKPEAKEPGLLFMDTFDRRNNQSNIGNHHIVRVINYLKNQINGTDLPLYDISSTPIDLFKQNSLKRPTGYVLPHIKLQGYRTRSGSPFIRRKKQEEPPPEETYIPPPPPPEPVLKKPKEVKEPSPRANAKADRRALRAFLEYYMSSIPTKSSREPLQRQIWEPPVRRPPSEEYIEEEQPLPVRRSRHVMRHRGDPPEPVQLYHPMVPKSDMGVQTAILSMEDNRIDASQEELPPHELNSTPPPPPPPELQAPIRTTRQFTGNSTSGANLLLNFDLPVTCFVRPSPQDPSKVRMTC